MKVYLAGPMRGYPDDNKTAFDEAAARLREAGHEVAVPYELDELLPQALLREHFGASLAWLCNNAEMIVVLPGGDKSRGVFAEVAVARALDIPVIPFEEALDD